MKILFKIYPQKSHFNATFAFAKSLQQQGHDIIYAGLSQMQRHVECQGFAYHVQTEDIFPPMDDSQKQPPLTFWTIVKSWRSIRRSARILRPKYERSDDLSKLANDLKPDLMLVDSPYVFFALSLYKCPIQFAILESMMPLDRAPGCPPLDTTYVPKPTWLSRQVCELHWHRYFIKRWILGKIGLRVDFNQTLVKQRAIACGLDPSGISFDRYFHIGLTHVPELFLSPQGLDFPRSLKPNQFFIGTSVDPSRQEAITDYRFEVIFHRMVQERGDGHQLVYCSLGTAPHRYRGAKGFLHRLIEAARDQTWNLIMAIGNQLRIEPHCQVPSNVAVFQLVPQLRVLKSADLMITHGGMNSINECTALNVPMVVYPGTKEIDQAGNAARVAYWQSGAIGSLSDETSTLIRRRITIGLTNRSEIATDLDRHHQAYSAFAQQSHPTSDPITFIMQLRR